MEIRTKKILRGTVLVPADKSISHRALMFSAISGGRVEITNCLLADDCFSTISCLRAMGASINIGSTVTVGAKILSEPKTILDAGNSGTTVRLMLGLLAGLGFNATFTGDDSLRKRPMARVTDPLKLMGANLSDSNFLPITVQSAMLNGINYTLPVPSAQVKSAILLAGLNAKGVTQLHENIPTRDHTERMLKTFGANIAVKGGDITLKPGELRAPAQIEVPNDISSAAFWLVAATIIPHSRITLYNVGINPTRIGILDALKRMGAKITLSNARYSGAEPLANIIVESAALNAVEISDNIPALIDEVPILAVAAAFAQGTTIIRNLSELRIKESDRLSAITTEFNKLSPDSFRTQGDDLIITGNQPKRFAKCFSHEDHRIAMALAIFATAAKGVNLDSPECVAISYPNFFEQLDSF